MVIGMESPRNYWVAAWVAAGETSFWPPSLAANPPRVAAPILLALRRGNPVETEVATEPLYSVGDQVRVLNIQTHGHTRAPRYVRGHIGTIHLHHGAHVFADLNAAGERLGHHLYNVRFDATELWRADSAGPGAVFVDLWEPYLASP